MAMRRVARMVALRATASSQRHVMWVKKRVASVALCWRTVMFFFFQAEDGIRDLTVTGVQTCALPICWVNGYGRWWFVALLPSLAMLLVAIAKRVGQYGVTEQRYFLLVLALWLLGLALYYGITASRNIKLIPMTLCAVALLTTMGPWSAYAVSRRSQMNRLDGLLEKNGMGRAGDPTPARGTVPVEDRREMSAVFHYLAKTHGPEAVGRVFGLPGDSVLAWADTLQHVRDDNVASRAMGRLGLRYMNRWERPEGTGTHVWAQRQLPRSTPVAGFEVALTVSLPSTGWIGTATDSLEYRRGEGMVMIRRDSTDLISLDVAAAVGGLLNADSLQRSEEH